MSEEIQKKLEAEVEAFKNVQRGIYLLDFLTRQHMFSIIFAPAEYQKAVASRQQLDGQFKENEIVKGELDLLTADATVYKSIGPILIKTELIEAKQNVAKRMDYIGKELKRVDELLLSLEKKQDNHREALAKLQHQFQQAQVKAAMRA